MQSSVLDCSADSICGVVGDWSGLRCGGGGGGGMTWRAKNIFTTYYMSPFVLAAIPNMFDRTSEISRRKQIETAECVANYPQPEASCSQARQPKPQLQERPKL